MTKRWLLVLTMMLVTLQTFAVAADVHALAPVEHTAEETLASATEVADKHSQEQHDPQCPGKCQSCCHHGFFHVLVPQSASAHYLAVPVLAPPYSARFSSLPGPTLFRPPRT